MDAPTLFSNPAAVFASSIVDKAIKEMAMEKLREDRYKGQINDEVRLGWDYEQTHIF